MTAGVGKEASQRISNKPLAPVMKRYPVLGHSFGSTFTFPFNDFNLYRPGNRLPPEWVVRQIHCHSEYDRSGHSESYDRPDQLAVAPLDFNLESARASVPNMTFFPGPWQGR